MNINLIDTDALLKVPNVCKVVEYDETGEFITYLAVPVEAIKKAPAIDAVPVVRCKDCKYRLDPKECFMCFTAVESVKGGNMYRFHDLTTDNGFCNRGENKDLEGNDNA